MGKNWSYFLAIACVIISIYGTIQALQFLLAVWVVSQWWDAKKAYDRGEKKKAIGLGIFGVFILVCFLMSVFTS